MNKEEIYDAEISPLMAQILAICKEHKIAMVASFDLPVPDDPDLVCTSALTTEEFEPRQALRDAVIVLCNPEMAYIAMTLTNKKPDA